MTVVSPEKDVDGFHPLKMGNLALRGRQPFFIPCAPKGCIELLLRFGVQISGKRSVVIGRSKIVGLPTALLLQVKICFSTVVFDSHWCNVLLMDRGTMQQSALFIHSPKTRNR